MDSPWKTLHLLSSILIVTPTAALAETPASLPEPGGGTASIHLENDLFGGEDRDYTNGARFFWLSHPLDISDGGSLAKVAGILAWPGLRNTDEVQYNYGFSLTQFMFTPESFWAYEQPQGERRYAGWFGLGFSLHAQGEHVLNSLEFTLGTVGPNAFAKEGQDAIHEVRNIDKFNGWDEQIPNEITADVSFIQKRRVDFDSIERWDFSMDSTLEWGFRLGTFRTTAHLGAIMRGSFHLVPDFSDLRISEAACAQHSAHTAGFKCSDWSAYFLGGAAIRGVAHDATLDGPLFRGFETGTTREAFVAEAFVGVGLAYRGVELSYVHTWRSKEYEEQDGISEFGSLGLRFRF